MKPLDPLRAFRVLNAHGVQFIVIGGIAGGLQGVLTPMMDLDICYRRSYTNYERLAAALRELHATLRGVPAGLPFQLEGKTISLGDLFLFNTDAGPLDCIATPAGTTGYDDLARNAVEMAFDDVHAFFASVDDVLRMKRAAGRRKDIPAIEILEQVKRTSR